MSPVKLLVMDGIFKKFSNDIKGVLWLGSAFFIALSLWSYTASDPSLNSASYNVSIRNYCGYFGSFLADLLYQGFGLTSWLIVISCLRISVRAFLGEEVSLRRIQFFWGVLLIFVSASLLALYFPEERIFDSSISVGGVLGLLMTKLMIKVFNFIGVSIILWSGAAILLIFYTQRTFSDFARGFKRLLSWLNAKTDFTLLKTALFSLGSYLKKPVDWIQKRRELSEPPQSQADFSPPSEVRFSLNREVEDEGDNEPEGIEEIEEELEVEGSEDACYESEIEESDESDGEKIVLSQYQGAQSKPKTKVKAPKKVANWKMPKLDLLDDPPVSKVKVNEKEVKMKARLLADKLQQFSVQGEVVAIRTGPAVTLFEFKPEVNVPVSKITKLENDLSLALSSESVRIIAPIPGRDVVGIETSNSTREIVYLKDILQEKDFWDQSNALPLCLGRRANGDSCVVDFRKMPHLLVAGSTGSGKSVFTVSCITGLIMRHSPQTMRLILVDPKQVDLAAFDKIPHLLMPPIYEAKKAVVALRWAVNEMEKRYRSLKKFGVRKIEEYNSLVANLPKKEVLRHQEINDEMAENGAQVLQQYYYTPQPYICVVVEEFGDLMSVEKADIEHQVVRLAQKARAAGIHLFLAMQSPRKDVVTGLIKTNIPGRVSFKVASKMDSRIILDDSGAERLLAQGDMLFLSPGVSKPSRNHGPWLSDEEIGRITRFWSDQSEPDFDPKIIRVLEGRAGSSDDSDSFGFESNESDHDDMYDKILDDISSLKHVSASLLQRKYRIGYPRAARLIELFEKEGVVGPAQGSKPRQVLVNSYDSPE